MNKKNHAYESMKFKTVAHVIPGNTIKVTRFTKKIPNNIDFALNNGFFETFQISDIL
jgi:hypothetical protein